MSMRIRSLCMVVIASMLLPVWAIDENSVPSETDAIQPDTQISNSPATAEVVEVVYDEGELEQLLAPIALYPDSLLTHILIASTYPLEIIEAERWLKNHQGLDAEQLLEQAKDKDWDPSVKALLPFEQVLGKLSEEINWTKQIGDAFLEAEEQVLASIQSLRAQADAAGNLEKMENTTVTRVEKTIVIEPASPQVIYVPYYDTRVVYGPWYWHHYPPVHWHHPHYEHYLAFHHHNPFYWHSGVHVSVGILFGGFHWHNHHVVVHHNHHYYRYHGHHHHGGHHNKHHNKHYKKHDSHGKQHYAGSSKKQVSTGSKRWRHEPSHRKGVAYRTDKIARQYKSNRHSVQQTGRLRAEENLKAVNYGRANHMSNAFAGNNKSSVNRSSELRTDVANTNKRSSFNRGKNIGRQTAQMRQDNFKQKLKRSQVNREQLAKRVKSDRTHPRLNTATKGKKSPGNFKRNDSSVYQTRYAKTNNDLKQSDSRQPSAERNYQSSPKFKSSGNTRSNGVNNGLARAFTDSKSAYTSPRSNTQRQAKITRPSTVQRVTPPSANKKFGSVNRSVTVPSNKSYRSVNRNVSAPKASNSYRSAPKVNNSYRSSPKASSISRPSSSSRSMKMSSPRSNLKSISRGPSTRGQLGRK